METCSLRKMLPDNLDQDVGLLRRGRSLDRRHADLLVSVVEDGVVLAHEDVSQNPHLAKLRRQLDRHKGEQALALDLEHVVLASKVNFLPPPKVISTAGRELILEQSIVYSLPMTSVAPAASAIFDTLSFGPASSDVPESMMAETFDVMSVEPYFMPSRDTFQYDSSVNGTYWISPSNLE